MFNAGPWQRCRHVLTGMGPGLLMAAAAIGASHLVASTQAGAEFGWQLAWLVVVVNLLKYPFFVAGTRYTAASGESLLHGYLRQGRGYLLLFTGLNLIAAIASTAGVTMLTAALLSQFVALPINVLAICVLLSCLLLLLFGQYRTLDKLSKIIMLALSLSTLLAVILAWGQAAPIKEAITPSPWQWAYVGFLMAMMGWMPAPIEVSSWSSLWLLEKQKTQAVTPKQAVADFNLGYGITALLALLFLTLGALVMHGTGQQFSPSAVTFANQLIGMYGQVMGPNSRYLIGFVALLCMLSTTVTVIDGYSRTLDVGLQILSHNPPSSRQRLTIMLAISGLGLIVIIFFKGALLPLLEVVMTLAFFTTSIFAWLNYRLMTATWLAPQHRFGRFMIGLSWCGLIYLFGFMGLFGYWLVAMKA
ncbi:NRAMP family divalent metal transporter [Shewanella sp. NIFS-20-20]|uniref:NRAMP family divalent metal transporter n=1 Tax=Shewanella sp. NIFS-20-20 TaxID=2853806 RepID=UPI001C468CC3|nr:divalent metal cation transporter [Shewanella sp. NIFS-20-20]MBV7316368.1 divalent metal cation transporter [Shewanella sp. NIFS-20-20]